MILCALRLNKNKPQGAQWRRKGRKEKIFMFKRVDWRELGKCGVRRRIV